MTTPQEKYPLAPESFRRDGVPTGVVTQHTWRSEVFPGTVRDYWVYVPAQYSPDKPACVMVFQDGGGYVNVDGRWRVPIVFDNLIHQKEMPVTIGIFINPGTVPPTSDGGSGRPNRSFEYDAVSGRYADFLVNEIFPEVAKSYNLSTDPNDYAISGGSSGGICSFTAAWFRPDVFRRILSFIGSFTNLRGGDVYASRIRKTEVKPIRVFVQSGSKDMNTYAGSWYVANQHMASSFEYMGYDYKVVLGDEGHNDIQGASVLPDGLRWLWRDYPQPITAPVPPPSREWATEIVSADCAWERIDGFAEATCVTAGANGNVYAADASGRIRWIDAAGAATLFATARGPVYALTLAPSGRLYAALESEIVEFDEGGHANTIVSPYTAGHLAVTRAGSVFFTDRSNPYIWQSDGHGGARLIHKGIAKPSGIRFSPNESLLAVADRNGRWGWSFQVQADGSIAHGEAFYRLEISDETSATAAAGVVVDTNGSFYFATDLGIQVCDLEGRCAFITANPPAGPASSIAFGGSDGSTLFASSGGRVYSRRSLRKGA
ncbi:MAG: alpha/beta hydrolase-fold protein [Capsulimonadaceae bacterium]|nr:alpha/beta hydrolase-fold protein [Capsulimonadaceae bacterium]